MRPAVTAAEARRLHMVETQLRRRDIQDERVLQAMESVPREEFVETRDLAAVYSDEPLSIGHGQTISQPYMTALMAQVLELTGIEHVLEVGAGSGYAAAVLSLLAGQVIATEIIPELAAQARENLKRAGVGGNVTVVATDGSLGYPESAPYDAISVAAGAPEVPGRLLDQLADPGTLVIPVGTREEQELVVKTKRGGRIQTRVAARCRFVLLRGGMGWRLL